MVSYLHDVSGALLLTCPTVADYENPDTHAYMEKYLRTMDGVTGEDRMKVFHVIRDLTADHYGGWAKITNQMVSGGLHAQRMATLRTFPSERGQGEGSAGGPHPGAVVSRSTPDLDNSTMTTRRRVASDMMMTGEQYKESLKDGRYTYLDGKRVTDPANEPRLKAAVQAAADVYDSFHSDDPDESNPIYIMPKSIEEFRERERLLAKGKGDMTLGTTGVILLTLATAAPELAKLKPVYREAIYEYIDYARTQRPALRREHHGRQGAPQAAVPASKSDPDFYVHVVDRTSDGVYINGCKMHISGSSVGHEQVVLPTKAMRPGRGGVRDRLRRAGQRAGRQGHRHHLRARTASRTPGTSRSAGIAARPKGS